MATGAPGIPAWEMAAAPSHPPKCTAAARGGQALKPYKARQACAPAGWPPSRRRTPRRSRRCARCASPARRRTCCTCAPGRPPTAPPPRPPSPRAPAPQAMPEKIQQANPAAESAGASLLLRIWQCARCTSPARALTRSACIPGPPPTRPTPHSHLHRTPDMGMECRSRSQT